jgi:flagellar biosynthetic protein FlhB
MAFDNESRTERATPKRRAEARKRGQVARSAEVNAAAVFLGAFAFLALAGAFMHETFVDALRFNLAAAGRLELSPTSLPRYLLQNLGFFGKALGPFLLMALTVALAAEIGQVGFSLTPESLAPQWNRLNVLAGLRNLCSVRALVDLARAALKLGLIGVVAYRTVAGEFALLPLLADMDLAASAAWAARVVLRLGWHVGLAYLVLAALDYGYQRWSYEKSLRMTKEEVKEEAKQAEGDPQIRGRIKGKMRELALRRMMAAVPKADVVIVNPIHFAVAIRYDEATMRAPLVVAKGRRLLAERIVELAREHRVPVVENPPLARTLYKLVEVGREIPAALYRAVAEMLAYVYLVERRRPAAAGRPAA